MQGRSHVKYYIEGLKERGPCREIASQKWSLAARAREPSSIEH